ncbi:Fc.00g045060.m01.CDS01 [Cosmosporella sp. VM-42]
MLSGKGGAIVGGMWALVAITWIFVVLRLYTRHFVLGQIGPDDHAYWLSGVLILLYTIFMHISANYGFGQPITTLDIDDAVKAVYYELIGQTFAVIGMGVAKVSLGLFLVRIVMETWHKVAIWLAMGSLMAVSVLTAIVLWVQCIPSASVYDPRVKGVCHIAISPIAITLGVWCATVDFFFAIFPWVFIWGLNMKRKEKITIAGSMSFGVVAGVCGIVRTVEVATGFTANYTEDTVGLIIWSAAEMAVTLVCVGIPVLRPLYRRVRHGSNFSSEGYYKKQSDGNYEGSYDLNSMPKSKGGVEVNHRGFPNADPKLGIRGPSTITRIAGDNQSDESILGTEYRNNAVVDPRDSGRIQVKEDVRVEWTKDQV